jgi:hypothetical protein
MAFKFIVTTILAKNPEKITIADIAPSVGVFDEADLAKAIAYCKFDADKDKPNNKITVETVYEEHPAYKAAAERLKAKNTTFGNVPYAKYIVYIENTLKSGGVIKTWFISTITFHNI